MGASDGAAEFDLSRAYSVETTADSLSLYEDWAESYDESFIASHGYVYHESVVNTLRSGQPGPGPVLDIGCGTGIVGIELRRQGFAPVDGVDLSPAMIEQASTKATPDGDPVYRTLLTADLTEHVDIADGTYAALVSAGTFTHGHLGPEPIEQLVRFVEVGGLLAIGVNSEYYAEAGFAAWFDRAVADGLVSPPELVVAPVYDPDRYEADDADEHANTTTSIALFRRVT